jgi:hypothetical protein
LPSIAQEKAKPAARQGRKITGLIRDSRVALKKVARLFFIKKDKFMNPYINLKCWEIINCDHLDCLARSEPETPCWEIAKRVEAFLDVSNTCRDCIIYLLQKETSVLSKKEIQEILRHRADSERIGTGYLACILKTTSND